MAERGLILLRTAFPRHKNRIGNSSIKFAKNDKLSRRGRTRHSSHPRFFASERDGAIVAGRRSPIKIFARHFSARARSLINRLERGTSAIRPNDSIAAEARSRQIARHLHSLDVSLHAGRAYRAGARNSSAECHNRNPRSRSGPGLGARRGGIKLDEMLSGAEIFPAGLA